MKLYSNSSVSNSIPINTAFSFITTNTTTESNSINTIKYNVFCVIWAMSILFHMAQSRIYFNSPQHLALTLAAIALIIKPSSVVRLSLLVSLQLCEVAIQLSNVSNHWIFTTFVSLTIAQTLLYHVIKNKKLEINKSNFIETLSPIVRAELLLLYFFVVLHKLNWSFISPDVSCATMLYEAQHLEFILPPSKTLLIANIYLTLIIESLIPLMLIFRKTRNIGLLIGLLFHGVIGLNSYNGFYDFSSIIFAVYCLFTDNRFSHTIYKSYVRIIRIKYRFSAFFNELSYKNCVFIAIIATVALLLIVFKNFTDYFQLIWGLYSILFISIFLYSLTQKLTKGSQSHSKRYSLVFITVPLLVFLNGICPYIGLKTEYSFAMFSNLRTEGGITNHLFIPASAQVFDFQKDMIEIISSSDPTLQILATEHKLVNFFQFKNHIATNKPTQVSYIRNGVQYSFNSVNASADNELLQKSPVLFRKLLAFRAIYKNEPQPCQH